ncbi:hypothetical protein NHQ30_005812 [Ciborinia camelliae]|nr:hypothetical protein NHQ30_005812 [Ciborinia camelliae]
MQISITNTMASNTTAAVDPRRASLTDLDEETINLMIQLQLEDITSSTSKGKRPEGEVSDVELAHILQKEEIERTLISLLDRPMTISMASALPDEGVNRSLGNLAMTSHALGIQEFNSQLQILGAETLVYLQELQRSFRFDVNSKDEDREKPEEEYYEPDEFTIAKSSTFAAPRIQAPEEPTTTCVSCQEETNLTNAILVPGSCRHGYCRACLERLYRLSITDESLFPPRCCGEMIPINHVSAFLPVDLIRAFEKKKIEFDTPNRIYCFSRACSAFIPPSSIVNDVATCPECGLRTHTLCKLESHTGDCSNDVALGVVLNVARERGWQRYASCLCGAHFCYTCGSRWQTCGCFRMNEGGWRVQARRPEQQLIARPFETNGRGSPPALPVARIIHWWD